MQMEFWEYPVTPVSICSNQTVRMEFMSVLIDSYLEYSTTLDRIQMYYDNEFVDVCSDAMEQTAVDNFCKIGGFIGGGVASSVGGTQVTNDTVRNVTCSKEMRSFSDCVVTLGDTCENGFLKISCLDTNGENLLYVYCMV